MHLATVFAILIILLIIIFTSRMEHFVSQEPIYIFWTGGYDSTFRLCQLLIDENKVVQPVYISDVIDNDKNKSTRRKNIKYELNSIKVITEKLNKKYPKTKTSLLPIIDIKKVTIDKDIQEAIRNLYKQKRMRRPVCQYGALAQVTRDLNQDIELSVEYAPKDSMMYRTVHDSLDCQDDLCHISHNLKEKDKPLKIFNRCIFSTIHVSKKDMLNIATKNGYQDILKLTWSCWYPVNGKPCGRCIMCHERVIK